MRIRTIKPEFWTHPVMARQKPEVQLLALGLLNLADDHGYFLADPGLVRSALCPFSDSSRIVHGSIITLKNIGWIDVRTHPSHGEIGLVVNFRKHQIVNREKPSKLREYFDNSAITDESRTNHGSISDPSLPEQGTGNREGIREKNREQVQSLRDAWNLLGKPFPKWLSGREDQAIAALKRRPIEEWRVIFGKIAASRFCRGETDSGQWVADIDWALRPAGKEPEPALKVLEGKFDNRDTAKPYDPPMRRV